MTESRKQTMEKNTNRRGCQAARLLFFAFSLIAFAPAAHAACSTPTGAAGDQIYNSTYNIMQYCNGTDRINMGAAEDIGTLTNGDFRTTDGVLINCTTSTISLTTQVSGTLQAAQMHGSTSTALAAHGTKLL